MKKHLIAAAVAAAVAVPAAAQVTVSGTLDITPLAQDKHNIGGTTVKRNSTTNAIGAGGGFSTSLLNFSGTEDLGGGLKASFLVNQVINSSTGDLTARERFISLTGGFGEFKAGRFSTLADGYGSFAAGAGTSNTAGTSNSAPFALVTGSLGADPTVATTVVTAGAAAGGDMGRQSGVVQYSTPTMSGIKVSLEYLNNSADTNATDNKTSAKQSSVSITYAAGPLSLNLTNASRDVTTEATVTNPEASLTWLGIRYALGSATLFVSHGKREDKSSGAKTSDIGVSNVGVQFAAGANTLFASVYDGEDKNHDGYQIGVRHALSKRTSVYLVNGENEMKGATEATTFKRDNTSIGLVHSF